jgi:hypothetical protein
MAPTSNELFPVEFLDGKMKEHLHYLLRQCDFSTEKDSSGSPSSLLTVCLRIRVQSPMRPVCESPAVQFPVLYLETNCQLNMQHAGLTCPGFAFKHREVSLQLHNEDYTSRVLRHIKIFRLVDNYILDLFVSPITRSYRFLISL